MMDSWTLYWITRLTPMNALISVIVFIFATFSIISIIVTILSFDKTNQIPTELLNIAKHKVAYFISFICLTIFAILIPTTKQMCAILVIPKIVNNEKVQNISQEFYDLAINWMKELKPKKKD